MGCGASSKAINDVVLNTREQGKPNLIQKPSPTANNSRPATDKASDSVSVHYRLGNLIGEGAYGKVYECLNVETGEILAVKHVELSGDSKKIVHEVTSLKKEISLLMNLKHRNVVRYVTTQVSDDLRSVDIIMEYVPGGSVRSLLNKFEKFHEKTCQKYLLQVLQGLFYLHSKGIMHRDIKCANLLVDNEGTVKLSDFGASKYSEDSFELNRSLKGSPYWIAPEVALRTGHSYSADIWSVGCVAIEMLTGNPPWSNLSKSAKEVLQIVANAKNPPAFPTGLSRPCNEFLQACLKVDPRQRASLSQLMTCEFICGNIEYVPVNELQFVEPSEIVYNIEDIPMTKY
jgi:serine/threonine protein kinase